MYVQEWTLRFLSYLRKLSKTASAFTLIGKAIPKTFSFNTALYYAKTSDLIIVKRCLNIFIVCHDG